MAPDKPKLRSLTDIYSFLSANRTPIYFVTPVPFNLLGLDQWVGELRVHHLFRQLRRLSPALLHAAGDRARASSARWRRSATTCSATRRSSTTSARAASGKVLLHHVRRGSERLVTELGLEMALPPAKLRMHIDSKIVTTRLGNEAGVAQRAQHAWAARPASPSCVTLAERRRARATTWWCRRPTAIPGAPPSSSRPRPTGTSTPIKMTGEDLKVMQHINHLPGTVEGCATRHGTLVGPIMTDITGFAEVTPYKGGWCGNDIAPDILPDGRAGQGARDGAASSATGSVAGGLQGRVLLRLPDRYRHRRGLSRRDSTRASAAPRRRPT